MADPYFGEIRIFAFDFAPMDWAYCNGQQINVSQNPALYSIIGTQYGGSTSQQTFNLPNLQRLAPLGMGKGPGLTPRTVGQKGGAATVTLTTNQVPPHSHTVNAIAGPAGTPDPTGAKPAQGMATAGGGRNRMLYNTMPTPANRAEIAANALSPFVGGGGAHNNMQPSLTLNFCICTNGNYPVRPS